MRLIWDISTKIEVIIEPKNEHQTARLLPKQDLWNLAHQIVGDFVGNQIQHSLIVKANFYKLGAKQLLKERCQLGCNSFLLSENAAQNGKVSELSFKG